MKFERATSENSRDPQGSHGLACSLQKEEGRIIESDYEHRKNWDELREKLGSTSGTKQGRL